MQIFFIVIFTANIFILNANPTPSKNKKYIVEVGNSPAKDKMEETAKKVAVPDDDGVASIPVADGVDAGSVDDGVDAVPVDDDVAATNDDGIELAAVPDDEVASVPVSMGNAGGNDYGERYTHACAWTNTLCHGCGCHCHCKGKAR